MLYASGQFLAPHQNALAKAPGFPAQKGALTVTPYTQEVRCGECNTQLTIAAIRDDGPRTSTTLKVSCPACLRAAEVVIPLSIKASSVQVVYYERTAAGTARRHT